MKKHFALVIILIFTLILSGCSNNDKKVQSDTSTVKTKTGTLNSSLTDLLNEKAPQLKIKIGNGSCFKATQYMTGRVMEMLKRNSPIERDEAEKPEYDVRLTFGGYEDICLDSKTGRFEFVDGKQDYGINLWSDQYFKRAMLKEIDGQVAYDSFEKDILKQNTITDVDNDGTPDEIILYYDGDIRLKVKDQDAPVEVGVISDAIASNVPTNNYTCGLYIKGAPDQNRPLSHYQFIVGITYRFVNKYGSNADIKCFEYKNGAFKESSFPGGGIEKEKIEVQDFKDNNLKIRFGDQVRNIKMDNDATARLKKFINGNTNKSGEFNWGTLNLYFPITTNYELLDYDNDETDELVIRTVLSSGSVGIKDILYSVYTFTDEGVKFKDSFFGSCNNSLEKIFYPE